MAVSKRLKDFLDENKVKYHVLKHHESYDSQRIAHALHVPGHQLAKVVVVKADGEMKMAVLPADEQVEPEALARLCGAQQVVLASEAEFGEKFPDCQLGAMPPFGNLYDLEVYVDRTLADNEEIVFEAGNHSEAIKLNYADFNELAKPKVGELGRPSHA